MKKIYLKDYCLEKKLDYEAVLNMTLITLFRQKDFTLSFPRLSQDKVYIYFGEDNVKVRDLVKVSTILYNNKIGVEINNLYKYLLDEINADSVELVLFGNYSINITSGSKDEYTKI